MTFFDELLNDKRYVLPAIANLILDERKRISASCLASDKKVNEFVDHYISYQQQDDKSAGNIVGLHSRLSSVKLPGDFEKIAADWYDAPKSTYTGEDFYKLPEKKEPGVEGDKTFEEEEPSEEETEEASEAMEELGEYLVEEESKPDEDHAEDCVCDGCVAHAVDAQMALAESVNAHLKKIAHSLGSKGEHDAAYRVEKAIRTIKVFASNGKLLNTKKRGNQ